MTEPHRKTPVPPPSALTPIDPNRLVEELYTDLRAIAARYLARERANHTLEPTELIGMAYLQLTQSKGLQINDRTHFLSLAARRMRFILVDHARNRGRATMVTLTDDMGRPLDTWDLVDLSDAIDKLAELSARQAQIIELRFFVGLTVAEVAREHSISERTVKGETRAALSRMRMLLTDREH